EAGASKDSLPSLMLRAAGTEFHIQPLLPIVIEVLLESAPVIRLKPRIDARFNRIGANEMRRETMNRTDLTALHLLEAALRRRPYVVVGNTVSGYQLPAGCRVRQQIQQASPQARLHLIRGIFHERERHNLGEGHRGGRLHQQPQEPFHKQGGLAGAGTRRDYDIAIEGAGSTTPRV